MLKIPALNRLTCQQTEIDTCHICLSNSLPFNSIDPLDFNFTFGNFSRLPSEEDMDKLMRLKFNPFGTKHTSIGNDDYYMLTNINNISCKYYLPNDRPISRDIPSNEHFSILNLNIRSIKQICLFKIFVKMTKTFIFDNQFNGNLA